MLHPDYDGEFDHEISSNHTVRTTQYVVSPKHDEWRFQATEIQSIMSVVYS